MLNEAGLKAAVEAAEGHHEKPLRAWEVTALRAAITAYLATVQGEPVAWRSRNRLSSSGWNYSDDQPQPHEQYYDEPLYTHPADRDGVEAGGNRAATFTYEDDEHAGPLYYFTPAIRPPGPYRQQRHVTAVVDIAADGSFAGVELIGNMPPLAPPASALKGGA